MKIFGAINDGYRFIYSEDETFLKKYIKNVWMKSY